MAAASGSRTGRQAPASASPFAPPDPRPPTRLATQLAGYHHLLHLVGALADGEDLGVAIEAADRILLDEAVAAMDLYRLLRRPDREAAGNQLCLGSGEGERRARVLLQRRSPGEQAGRLDLSREIGDLGLDRLELGDRLAKRLALLGVGDRLVKRALREPHAHSCNPNPASIEDVKKVLEALTPTPEQVPLRHPAVLEAERPRIRSVPTHLPVPLANLIPRRPVGHDQIGDLLAPIRLAGNSSDRDASRDVRPRVRNELLSPVDDPFPTIELCCSPHVPSIRPSLRLSQPKRGKPFPGAQARQTLTLLLVAAPEIDRHRPQRGVRGHRDADRRIDPRKLFNSEHVRERVRTAPAVLLRERNPHESQSPELADDLVGKALRSVQLLGNGLHLGKRKLPHRVPKKLLLVRKIEVHGRQPIEPGEEGRGCPSGQRRPGFRTDHSARAVARQAKTPATGGTPPPLPPLKVAGSSPAVAPRWRIGRSLDHVRTACSRRRGREG